MLLGEILLVAFGAIRANKLRSFLTMLGIIIGIAAVIAMVALGEGAQRQVEARLATLGTNVLTVRPGRQFMGGVDRGDNRLVAEDVEALARAPVHIKDVAPEMQRRYQVSNGPSNANLQLLGTWPAYFGIDNARLAAGRLFTREEERGRLRVAVTDSEARPAIHRPAIRARTPALRSMMAGSRRCRAMLAAGGIAP